MYNTYMNAEQYIIILISHTHVHVHVCKILPFNIICCSYMHSYMYIHVCTYNSYLEILPLRSPIHVHVHVCNNYVHVECIIHSNYCVHVHYAML